MADIDWENFDPLAALEATREGPKTKAIRKAQAIKLKGVSASKLDRWALNPKKLEIWRLSDKDLRDLFIKFVGFVGYYDAKDINPHDGLGYAILDPNGEVHKGEANPEPIDDITGDYKGIADYQADAILDYRDNFNLLTIWPRGHGKSWVREWIIEITMKYEADRYLYFSLTDAAYKASNDVYIWAQNNNAIVASDTIKAAKKISGRISSYQKFTLINGAQFEVHGIRTASTLGYHGWIIIFDDIIDISHKDLPHLQDRLESKWDSQYSKIRRKKLCIDNTRKFPGDFFDFIMDQFENKQKSFIRKKGRISKKYTLFVSHKTPYQGLEYKGNIGGYRGFLKALGDGNLLYDVNKVIAGWFDPDDFEIMKYESLSSFNAEMMGNPLELEGGMFNPGDILYVKRPIFGDDIQMGGTGVDSANTEDTDNDYCAVVSTIMHEIPFKENYKKRFTTYRANVERMLGRNHEINEPNDPYDWTDERGRKIKRGLIETVQLHCTFFLRTYPGKKYIIAMERNNAGIAFIEQALHMYRHNEKVEIKRGIWVEISWPKYLVEDQKQATKRKKKGKHNIVLGITHQQEKVTRVYSELKHSIEIQEKCYTPDLEDSLLIAQLKVFPNGKHDDGPDADGMIKDELDKRWRKPSEIHLPREAKQLDKVIQRAAEKHELAGQPWLKDKKRAMRSTIQRRYK